MNDPREKCRQAIWYEQLKPLNQNDECRTLPTAQAVLLWCVRMWVMQLRRGIPAQQDIDNMLDALGVLAASPHLKGFISALSHGATRMIEVQCMCRSWICPDERALLDVLSLAQAARPFEATLVLRGFVTPEGAASALRCAEGIGRILAGAGHFLPEPEEAVRHYALSATSEITPHAPSDARPFDATLH